MDDGFQNPAITKDASLIVIDGDRGLGNGCVIPAGPLRAPLQPQLARTEALIVIGAGTAAEPVAAAIVAQGKPVLRAHLTPDGVSLTSLRGKPVLAFAGIGDPARFFRTLRAAGIEVVAERSFADHHPFSRDEIESLIAEAKHQALTLVTTGEGLPGWAKDIVPFAVTLTFEDTAGLRKFVAGRLFQAREMKFRDNS
jgi:tetraacyldisaccharide 4'-kinase